MSQVLTNSDNSKIVRLHIGNEILLRLPENAATGYRWSVEAVDSTLVDLHEGEYLASSDAIGSGGEAQWRIQAKAVGAAVIKFKRWRRWEGESSVRDRFEFTLQILP